MDGSFISRDVQLMHDHMSLKKENWTPKQLVVILLDIQKNLRVSSFTILALEVSLKLEMHISLRILNLMGEIKLETLTFKKNTMIVLIQKVI